MLVLGRVLIIVTHPFSLMFIQIASWLPPVRLVALRRCNLCCGWSVAVLLELPGRERAGTHQLQLLFLDK